MVAPSAQAVYYSYGEIKAYEGTRFVAAGKGNHGMDFPTDAIGGHAGSRDPLPGGSPAQGRIRYQYGGPGVPSTGFYTLKARDNYKNVWIDDALYADLNTSYSYAETYGEVCQNDTWPAPDDCAASAKRNHKW